VPAVCLVDLALAANLAVSDEEKSILDILTEYIIWDGRYPTPKKPQHLRSHWKNQSKELMDEAQLLGLKGGKSNEKLNFENIQPIWRKFSDSYLVAYG